MLSSTTSVQDILDACSWDDQADKEILIAALNAKAAADHIHKRCDILDNAVFCSLGEYSIISSRRTCRKHTKGW